MMLPHAYELPAAVALMVGGALACFASMMGVNNAAAMLVGAAVGGLIGAVVLIFAYIVGIAVAGAGLGAAIAHLAWTQFAVGDPPLLALVVPAIAGAIAAMLVQRYMIIVCTAFGGAWTILVGAVNLVAARGVPIGNTPLNAWILYPASIGDQRWAPYAWIVIGLIGSSVQLSVTGRKR
jgi:hypothetical protein